MEMFQKMDKCDIMMLWGRSSVDRALHSHCRGREFESHRLHHCWPDRAFLVADGIDDLQENVKLHEKGRICRPFSKCKEFLAHHAEVKLAEPNQ